MHDDQRFLTVIKHRRFHGEFFRILFRHRCPSFEYAITPGSLLKPEQMACGSLRWRGKDRFCFTSIAYLHPARRVCVPKT